MLDIAAICSRSASATIIRRGSGGPWIDHVLSAFGRMIIKEGGFDPALGGELRRLFELRGAADYMWLDELQPDDYDPIDAAERFVDGVEQWLNTQTHERADTPQPD